MACELTPIEGMEVKLLASGGRGDVNKNAPHIVYHIRLIIGYIELRSATIPQTLTLRVAVRHAHSPLRALCFGTEAREPLGCSHWVSQSHAGGGLPQQGQQHAACRQQPHETVSLSRFTSRGRILLLEWLGGGRQRSIPVRFSARNLLKWCPNGHRYPNGLLNRALSQWLPDSEGPSRAREQNHSIPETCMSHGYLMNMCHIASRRLETAPNASEPGDAHASHVPRPLPALLRCLHRTELDRSYRGLDIPHPLVCLLLVAAVQLAEVSSQPPSALF